MVISCVVSFSSNQEMTQGSIRITDTTDLAGQGINPVDIEFGFGIVGPDGETYRSDTIPQIGNIHPAVQLWQEFPLPTGVDGKIMTGTYVISYHGYTNIGPQEARITVNALLCTDLPTLCLDPNPNCLTLVVSVTDATGWEDYGWAVNSRAMTLQYPSITYHATITGAGPTISTSGEPIWNGTWTATSTVNVTKDNYTVTISVVKQFEVVCDFDGCKLLCLFEGIFADLQSAERRGAHNEVAEISTKLYQMSSLSQMISMSIACGDSTFLSTLMERFRMLATGKKDSNCDCCDDCGEPRMLVPIWSSGGGTSWTPIAGSNITITPGVNTYTFSVSAAFAALVGALSNTVVAPGAGISVSASAPLGNPPTITYTVVNTKPAPDSISFKVRYDLATFNKVIEHVTIVGTTFANGPITITDNVAGVFSQVSGFIPSGTPQYIARVEVVNRTLKPAYQTQLRYDAMALSSEVHSLYAGNPTTFLFGLTLISSTVGGVPGRMHNLAFYAQFMTGFELEVTITKIN